QFDDFEEFEQSGQESVYDPLSGYNRAMTTFNDKLYFWVLKPAATGYAWVAPQPVRRSVHRFFKNLGYPVRLVNNLLQLKGEPAADETLRFAFNSTVGVLGFFDPARNWLNLEPHSEDFGQTLGSYGLGGGFPLVLPFMGPSNLRDTVGMVPDLFLDPVDYYVGNVYTSAGLSVYERVNYTSLHLGQYEKLKKDAVDWYIFIRNAYEQNREQAIKE
ncbi:MAG: MlaA family lipoprotein, partial [Thermodesulfobacteriota bacterium]